MLRTHSKHKLELEVTTCGPLGNSVFYVSKKYHTCYSQQL